MLTCLPDPLPIPEEPEQPDGLRTVSKKIPIAKDDAGCPILPSITPSDNYKTKIVQSMLREYCTAHMRECCTAY